MFVKDLTSGAALWTPAGTTPPRPEWFSPAAVGSKGSWLGASAFNPLLSSERQVRYDAIRCDVMRCDAMRRDATRCDAMRCDAMRCDAMRCDSIRCDSRRGEARRIDARRGEANRFGARRCDASRGDVSSILSYPLTRSSDPGMGSDTIL